MRVSVVLTTYNAPDWLAKVVWGYSVQSHRDFELLIADDGSTDETAACIEYLRRSTDLVIRHVWHEHCGFRKCTILNRAIELARGDYLVFSDGDCIPRWDFLQQHLALAERGRFLSGGAIRLPMGLSQAITPQDIFTGRVTRPAWLRARGLTSHKYLLRLALGYRIARLLDVLTPTKPTWNGGNSSAWKSDILRVNGFDERMAHGGLDRELGQRLVNAGVRPKQVRHRAICLHLDHDRAYASPDGLARNRAIRRQTQRRRVVWTRYGITQGTLPAEPPETTPQVTLPS